MQTHKRAMVRLGDLVPATYNPRTITKKAAEGLRASIERFGLVQEIVVNKRNNTIVGGHQRLQALRDSGLSDEDKVPVVWVDLAENEERALNITLNNSAIAGEFDDEKLQTMLQDLAAEMPLDVLEELRLDELATAEPGAGLDPTPQLGAFTYSVIVQVDGEQGQKKLMNELEKAGYKCRALIS